MTRQSWGFRLGTLGTTEVWLDATWMVVLPFAAWSLAVVYFPENYPVFGAALDWGLGLAGAVGLAASALLHEAAHVFVEQFPGAAPRGVTVYVVGSVARPSREPQERHGTLTAMAGPIVSGCLAVAAFWGALNAGPLSRPVEALLGYLAIVNVLIVALHAIPGSPFDAGVVVRLVLIRIGLRHSAARWIPVALGALAAGCLLVAGGWQLISGRGGLVGLWLALAGALVFRALNDTTRSTAIPPTPASPADSANRARYGPARCHTEARSGATSSPIESAQRR